MTANNPSTYTGGVSIQKSVKLIEIIFTHAIVLTHGNYRSHTEYIITHESQKYKKTVRASVLKLGFEGLISFDRDDVTLALLGGLAN